ncbi:MAG: amidohydrolase family protein [Bdellovibrionaceae bacterium]|nr:amidohydrolase family protein [Pseudobdellovibrionaceae bacterium]
MLLKNLADSHVHLMATGQIRCTLSLAKLRDWRELSDLPKDREFFRDHWYVGFGWDENLWPGKEIPTAQQLDQLFPDFPVYFSRCDGHSGLTNSLGLRELGRTGSGLFKEKEHLENLGKLPAYSDEARERFLIESCRTFNEAGFTHVRDLGGNESQFLLAQKLEKEGRLTLQVDWNFPCQDLKSFENVLRQAIRCRQLSSAQNELKGIKFFFDGSLGSDTALLSKPYAHRCDHSHGRQVWSDDDAKAVIQRSWENGFEVAVHTIGDEAVDRIVNLAREVSSKGIGGRLNLEHAEVLQPETIKKMKPLHVVCHLQPCHWLSDKAWLDQKLGELKAYAFPWEALRRAKIPFFFGSDSPIEPPSLFRNLQALDESVSFGIAALKADPIEFHLCPSPRVSGETEVKDGQIERVVFQNKIVFQRKPELI